MYLTEKTSPNHQKKLKYHRCPFTNERLLRLDVPHTLAMLTFHDMEAVFSPALVMAQPPNPPRYGDQGSCHATISLFPFQEHSFCHLYYLQACENQCATMIRAWPPWFLLPLWWLPNFLVPRCKQHRVYIIIRAYRVYHTLWGCDWWSADVCWPCSGLSRWCSLTLYQKGPLSFHGHFQEKCFTNCTRFSFRLQHTYVTPLYVSVHWHVMNRLLMLLMLLFLEGNCVLRLIIVHILLLHPLFVASL